MNKSIPIGRWPNILSLDVALIASCWQYFLSVELDLPLAWSHFVILGAGVWLAYVADRWLDGLRIPLEKAGTARHRFYIVYRYPVLLVWFLVLTSAIVLAHSRLDRQELLSGWVLVVVCLIYALFIQRPGNAAWGWLFPKELWASILYVAGVFLFLWDKGIENHAAPILAGAAFFLLCFANCSLMSKWESQEDQKFNQESLCLKWPAWAGTCKWLAVAATMISLGFLILMPGEKGLALIIAFNLSGWGAFFPGLVLPPFFR